MATHGKKSFQCCQIQRFKERLSRIPMGFSQTSQLVVSTHLKNIIWSNWESSPNRGEMVKIKNS